MAFRWDCIHDVANHKGRGIVLEVEDELGFIPSIFTTAVIIAGWDTIHKVVSLLDGGYWDGTDFLEDW